MVILDRCSTCGIGQKPVVNVTGGVTLGYVTDIEFEICEGKIVSLIVGDCTLPGFSQKEELVIPWCKIRCIGEDVILTDVPPEECRRERQEEKRRRRRPLFGA